MSDIETLKFIRDVLSNVSVPSRDFAAVLQSLQFMDALIAQVESKPRED